MNDKHHKTKHPFYFYIITGLVPVALVVFAELTLRALDIGRDLPLFIETPEFKGYYVVNPAIIERYVADTNRAPDVRPDAVFFKKVKPTGSFRIFVQGGSSAAGFPFGRNASLQAMLNQRFKRLYPDKKIEIVSTAMAAVNSYTLLDFVDEIIAQKPDLVLIYAGHNEYLGIMGVGSMFSSSSSRFITLLLIEARKYRLFQTLESAFYPAATEQGNGGDKRTLMSKIVKETSIPHGSKQYRSGFSQFDKNLSSILATYRKAGVPVMIGTLASNEQDQVPFSTINRLDWQAYQSALDTKGAPARIKTLLGDSNEQDKAAVNYKLGLNYSLMQNFEAAREHFRKARDLDTLRFRAPSEFNDVIRRVAVEHDAVVVDSEQNLRADTDFGIIGKHHMLEHVHPTERGYFLLAEAFAEKIRKNNLIGSSVIDYSTSDAWNDSPVTKVDRLNAQYVIEKLVNDYPFVTTPNKVPPPATDTLEGEALNVQASGIDWRDYNLELMRRYQQQGDLIEAARIAANASDAMITDAELASFAGRRYLELKDYALARYYYLRATQLDVSNRQYWLSLAEVYFHLGDREKSEKILELLGRSAD